MAKYVDTDTIVEKLWSVDPENDGSDGCTVVLQNLTFTSADLESLLDEIPAADVVEVVRCQNCAYSHKGCDSDMTKEIWCTYWQKTEGKAWNMMHFDDFCSHGAKMDLEEHHESNYL